MAENIKDMIKTAIDEEKTVDAGKISEAAQSLISENKEIQDELSLTGEIVFNVKSDPVLGLKIEIKDGKASFSSELAEQPDFFMEISSKTLKEIITGEKDAITPFMGGEIAMWKEGVVGDMSKAMDMIPLITAVAQGMELSV